MKVSFTSNRNVVSATTNGQQPTLGNRISSFRSMKCKALFTTIFVLFISSTFNAKAVTRFSTNTGNWSATSSWSTTEGGASGATVPVAGDVVIISGGDNITVDVATAACASVQLGSLVSGNGAGTLTFAANSVLTVSGAVAVGAPGSSSRIGTITMTSGGLLKIGGTCTMPANSLGGFTPGTGTIEYNGTAQTVLDFTSVSGGVAADAYNNLTLSNSGSKTTTGVHVNGTLSLQGTATVANAITYGAAATLEYKGSAAQTSSNNEFPAALGANLVINNVSGVTLNANKTVSGNLSVQTGTFANGGFSITLAVNKNFSVANGATFTLSGGSAMVAVSGTGTKTFGATSIVNYSGASAQAVSAENYGNINLSGGTTKTLAASAISIFGNLTIAASTVANGGANTYTIYGNITNDGTVSGGSSTVILNGASAQTISGLQAISFNNLTINNASGIVLSQNASVAGTLSFSSGKLDIGNNILTLSSNAVGAVSGYNSSRYIITGTGVGRVRYSSMAQNSTYTFPVGNATYYLPVTVQPLSAVSDFSINVFQGATTNGSSSGTAFDANAKKGIVDAVWNLDRNSGSGNANISLQWDPALEGSAIAGKSGTQIGISHYTTPGPAWQNAVPNAANTTTVASATFNSFSPFGVGFAALPLPIVLNYFTGNISGNNAVLQWATANEDARIFTLEKSLDGKSFSTLAPVPANASKVYEYKDPIAAGTNNFYRLKMEETNGTISYSNVVNLKTNKLGDASVTIAPNPVTDYVTVIYPLTTSAAALNIIDMQGRVVYKQTLAANTDQNSINVNELPKGVYLLRIEAGTSQIQQLFYHL